MKYFLNLTLLFLVAKQINGYSVTKSRSPPSIENINGVTRYRARVAYDGSGFQGFQLQPRRRTVQGDIEDVLSQRFQKTVRVVGAGRTDAGVHARGQAIHFDLETGTIETKEELQILEYSVNRMLRNDVRIYSLQEAPVVKKLFDGEEKLIQWSAMYDSTEKLYVYRISVGKSIYPLERHNRIVLKWPNTNIAVLKKILKHYEGYHDFRAFSGRIEQLEKETGEALDTRRRVYSIELVEEGDNRYRIEVKLQGALYKMVRNMVGTALEVAWGKLSEEDFLVLLNRSNSAVRKTNKSKPAPPEGLTLEQVYYDDY
eukprot:CAMPEP_0194201226 /NCGR_PEP_ID=MMETSP0156-20130528/1546_1 /TAXON_ID=33649 /ORGANISM="Thalassionema nitzschioides, Strain L26-B" /LENGTH=313 /DNA_ID=CAMNT_0038926359 /DNA_START=1 /DNA_END=942 /DNA_ORIENTATION=+